jgi:protocatechuate 3,4-dioxygenase beta subunit
MSEFDSIPRSRRELLGLLGGLGAAFVIAGCGGDDAGSTATPTTNAPTAAAVRAKIPEETAGPFPGDGSNGPNVLTQPGVVRRDIRTSIGSASGVAKGVPLTIDLTVLDSKNGYAPLVGAAVYVWHCDIDGGYSMYSQGVANENYLRGVQETDANGLVRFTSIFPAAYSGRWPHIHFEVFPSLAKATVGSNKVATSQLALPEDVCKVVVATDGYSRSVTNLAQTSLARDNVFSDGVSLQMATLTGSPTAGYVATLAAGV